MEIKTRGHFAGYGKPYKNNKKETIELQEWLINSSTYNFIDHKDKYKVKTNFYESEKEKEKLFRI